MAAIRWRGDAPAVAQVITATPANVEVGDQFSLTINGKSISYTAAAATVADVVAGLADAVSDSDLPEFEEVQATDTASEVTLVARTPGVPLSIAASTVNGGGADTQTLTIAEVTPSSGPHHWDAAANWSSGSVPGGGDDVFIEDSETSILFGLEQSAVVLDSLQIAASFTGEIGLPRINDQGSTSYAEYRPRTLQIGAAALEIGSGDGLGSGRIRLDTGSAVTALMLHASGISLEDDVPAIVWKGTHASNLVTVADGNLGIAVEGGDTAVVSTLRQAGGSVSCAPGVTLTTIQRSGNGELRLQSDAGTLVQSGGETEIRGSAAVGTLQLDGGRVAFLSDGTITTLDIDGVEAVIDFSCDVRPRTVSACTLRHGSIIDPHGTVTWTGGIQPVASLRGE